IELPARGPLDVVARVIGKAAVAQLDLDPGHPAHPEATAAGSTATSNSSSTSGQRRISPATLRDQTIRLRRPAKECMVRAETARDAVAAGVAGGSGGGA